MKCNVNIYRNEETIAMANSCRVDAVGRSFVYSTIKPFSEKKNVRKSIEALKFAVDEMRKFEPLSLVMIRFHLSDVSTQSKIVRDVFADEVSSAISIVGQPPLCDEKVIAVAWFESNVNLERIDEETICVKGGDGEDEYITTHIVSEQNNSYVETISQLEKYESMLKRNGMIIANDCIRTWFFVRDIDRNYKGVVDARRENFLCNGLTPETHYIASTGIQGNDEQTDVTSILDAYAIKNIPQGNVHILYASEKMNKTIEYGVTFERGVAVDRACGVRQVFVSGTASIDNKGNVLHTGDIEKQVDRMLENVEALLVEAEMNWEDVAQATVYLRDHTDARLVEELISARIPQIAVVLAPVCRPTWLVEMEAVAIKKLSEEQ